MKAEQKAKITDVLLAHTLHLISPATDDPNGEWEVICDCDARITTDGFLSGEKMHAAHKADALAPVLDAMFSDVFEEGQERPTPNPYRT